MTDGKALMKAIIESPDDDAPRLIYADWLDETGDPAQAAYIRLQCAKWSPATPEAQRRAAEARLRSLAPWQPPVLPGISWDEPDRGYPRRVKARRWADLRAAWDTVFSVAPVVWVIVPDMTGPELDQFLTRPETGRLQYVFLSFDAPLDKVAKRLAGTETTDGWLDLVLGSHRENRLTDRGADSLLAAKHLRRLTSLSADLTGVSPDRQAALRQWTAARVT